MSIFKLYLAIANIYIFMSIQIFHTSDDAVCRTKKKQTQNHPPNTPLCDTLTMLHTVPLNVHLSHKNMPKLSAFGLQRKW